MTLFDTKHKRTISKTIILVIICAIVIIYLVPIYWIFITSIKPEAEAMTWPPRFIPKTVTLDNYKAAFEFKSILWYMKNSIIIALGSVLLSMFIGSLASYSFAKMNWNRKRRKNIVLWIVSLRIMPPIAVAIPIYLIFISLKLLDTFLGMILAYVFFNLPFVIWLTYGFFKELPNEIIEAAKIDGSSFLDIFGRIAIPLAIPGFITVFLLTFMTSWNEFLFAIKLTAFKTRTLPVLIGGFIIDRGLQWGQLCAVAAVTVLPVIIIAFLIQKYIVSGLTFGAIK
jgi:multiple sugar transport system permease protein